MSARLRLPARARSAAPSTGSPSTSTSRRSTLTRGLAVAGAAAFLATGATACTGGGGAPSGSQLYALRMCESGGNPAINTGNGYYGAYQFDLRTWRGLGFRGYPHQASLATQDAAVRKLYAQRGWAPWPVCGQRARYA